MSDSSGVLVISFASDPGVFSAPPLAIMPLAAREMHVWLSGSPERVAVLHCKGGGLRTKIML